MKDFLSRVPKSTQQGLDAKLVNRSYYTLNSLQQRPRYFREVAIPNGLLVRDTMKVWENESQARIDSTLVTDFLNLYNNQVLGCVKLLLDIIDNTKAENITLNTVLDIESLLRPEEFDLPREIVGYIRNIPNLNRDSNSFTKHLLEISEMYKNQKKVIYQLLAEARKLNFFIEKRLKNYQSYLDKKGDKNMEEWNIGGQPKEIILDLVRSRVEKIHNGISEYTNWLKGLQYQLEKKDSLFLTS